MLHHLEYYGLTKDLDVLREKIQEFNERVTHKKTFHEVQPLGKKPPSKFHMKQAIP